MKQLAYLEYKFLFDPSDTFSSLSQFESMLVDYFNACDMDIELVKSVNGQIGGRLMIIQKKPQVKNFKAAETKSPKDQVGDLMKKAEGK